ncbi:hypothetical protein [Bacillus manliponensis]|uniref:hypothetical protein n=1 Tax=Bacillus manliponensis TaxID=574376 RepID=UPI0012FAAD53|nr:hypothetical protein [Bacillus manliponensis]
MGNTITPFSYGNHSDNKGQDIRKFYIGIDIGKKKMMIKMKSSRIANQRVIIIKG